MRQGQEPQSTTETDQPRRLRKQPKMRRYQSATAVAAPQLVVPRTAKKRRQRNNNRLRAPLMTIRQILFSARWISLLLLALTTFGLYLVGMDANFYLTTIPVDGVSSIPATEIVSASRLGGIHVFAADPRAAAESIAQVPGVISATVTLSWPNQVHIQVKEDVPVAIWQENGQDFWVTEDGRLLPARVNTLGLLQIESEIPINAPTTIPPATTEANDTATQPPAASQVPEASITFIPPDVLAGALQLRDLRPNIEKLYYRPAEGLSYQDGRGWRAYFGVGTDMAQKLAVYETIIADLNTRELTPVYVSVSNQQKPYYLAH